MKSKKLFKLFISSFMLSAFTFGGGYVIISLMKKKYVDELQWLDEKEMLDYTAIAQSSPGAVAVNAAILVGFRIAGIAGAVISVIGTILPPFIILSVISAFYKAFCSSAIVSAVLKGMQAGVAAVIADVVVQLIAGIKKKNNILSFVVMVLAFAATYFWKINIILIILLCGITGVLQTALRDYKCRKAAGKGL